MKLLSLFLVLVAVSGSQANKKGAKALEAIMAILDAIDAKIEPKAPEPSADKGNGKLDELLEKIRAKAEEIKGKLNGAANGEDLKEAANGMDEIQSDIAEAKDCAKDPETQEDLKQMDEKAEETKEEITNGEAAECEDSEPDCAKWAAADECENNPFWMLPNCQKSCDSCGTTVGDVKAPKTAPAKEEAPAEGEAPAEEEAPAETEAPAKEEVPAETEAPAEKEAPAKQEAAKKTAETIDDAPAKGGDECGNDEILCNYWANEHDACNTEYKDFMAASCKEACGLC